MNRFWHLAFCVLFLSICLQPVVIAQEKYNSPSVVNPSQFLSFKKSKGLYPTYKAPRAVIFCYSRVFKDYVLNNSNVEKCDGIFSKLYFLKDTNHEVAIMGDFGIGAPATAYKMEQLIAWGVKEFLIVGTAGGLQKDLKIGDIILCNKAIRGEGTSSYYLPPSQFVHATSKLTSKIEKTLQKKKLSYRKGTSWTCDAIFRETEQELQQFQKEGVLCVEMEASAAFAVASFRDVEASAIFAISDSLHDLQWRPDFYSTKTEESLKKLYHVAVETLQG